MTNQAKTSPLLSVQGLKTFFDTDSGVVRAVDGVSLEIKQGETFALVGESGCGKSVTALSVIRLIPSVTGRLADGSVTLKGHDLMTLSERQMRAIRGKRIAMIFQDPMTSLNPVHTVKQQIREVLVRHASISADEANSQVLELLNAVGLPDIRINYPAE
jgi:ABC-type dipeptide/oligopeptide/nickel transport system ATPase component